MYYAVKWKNLGRDGYHSVWFSKADADKTIERMNKMCLKANFFLTEKSREREFRNNEHELMVFFSDSVMWMQVG